MGGLEFHPLTPDRWSDLERLSRIPRPTGMGHRLVHAHLL